jgi:recombination associated protein RdgC
MATRRMRRVQLMVESKLVPGSVVKRQVETLAAQIEKTTGRKPGKKETRELKDQALLDLLPMAFTKRGTVKVWISPASRLLVIDAGSASRADETLTALTQVLPGLSAPADQHRPIARAAMADWLVSGEPPTPFTIDRDCELKAADGEKPVVRYARHALDLPEIREHIAAGKRPTRLALTWNGRVSFTLTESLQLKKIELPRRRVRRPGAARGEDEFDADAAILTGELGRLLPDLIEALGGEQQPGIPASEGGAAASPATLPAGFDPHPAPDSPPF